MNEELSNNIRDKDKGINNTRPIRNRRATVPSTTCEGLPKHVIEASRNHRYMKKKNNENAGISFNNIIGQNTNRKDH